MQQRLIKIIESLRDVIHQQDMNVSDDVLFREAVSCWRGEQAALSKGTFKKKEEKVDSPTEGQLKVLNNKFNESKFKRLGIDPKTIKTKQEASKAIDKIMKKD